MDKHQNPARLVPFRGADSAPESLILWTVSLFLRLVWQLDLTPYSCAKLTVDR